MSDPAFEAREAAATAYQEFFVPALFEEWAPRVADAAQIRMGQRVLDVACGTGVLAREAASRVGAGGSVAGLDANDGMLGVAARLAPAIEWQLGTAESLPYADRAFDVVVSQFGLMFFADRPRSVGEMLRVLVSGGRFAVAVWDALENAPAYAAEVELLERLAGPRAADAIRAPFVLGDREALIDLFTSAGAASTRLQTVRGVARFPSIRAMVEADVRGWLPLVGVDLAERQIQSILAEADRAIGPHVATRDGIRFDVPAHIVSGTRP